MNEYLEYGNEGTDCKNESWKRVPLGHAKNLSGIRINNMLPLFRVEKLHFEHDVHWLCKCCLCGNIKIASTRSLRKGDALSCGCNRYKTEDLSGKRFNHLYVLERDLEYQKRMNNRRTYWKCLCDCGNIITTRGDSLQSGHTKSCGCKYSLGETKISKILLENNINFIRNHQVYDEVIKTKKYAKFDFAILNSDNTIAYYIEY